MGLDAASARPGRPHRLLPFDPHPSPDFRRDAHELAAVLLLHAELHLGDGAELRISGCDTVSAREDRHDGVFRGTYGSFGGFRARVSRRAERPSESVEDAQTGVGVTARTI